MGDPWQGMSTASAWFSTTDEGFEGHDILPASFSQQLLETGGVPTSPKLQLVSLPFSFLSSLAETSGSCPAHVPTLLLLSLGWGGQQQGSSFPGCRQGWEYSLVPGLLGWASTELSQLQAGQEEVQSCRTRLPLSFPAG